MRNAIGKALAIIAVIAGSLLSPASAGGEPAGGDAPFVVVNAASYQASPVAGGALWTIYTQDRVSPEESWTYSPWQTKAHNGLWVEASCDKQDAFLPLPILYVGFAFSGSQINAYRPNAMGSEPWGSCAYTGTATVRIHTASQQTIESQDVVVLPAHPGIFAVGDAPAGDHVDADGNHTPISTCPTEIKLNPKACPVRSSNGPSELWVTLTGAEWFVCDPCFTADIRFELAPSPTAPDSDWMPQTLRQLITTSTGVEQAKITIKPDVAPGVYYLRVRNTFRPEYPTPLRVELGQPF